MILQISSGQGPTECELAVSKLYEALKDEYSDIELVNRREGKEKGCCSSITFSTNEDLSELEGSVQWICRSPFRPHHKRKNWFVDVSIIPERGNFYADNEIRFERFHCGGKGGQNVELAGRLVDRKLDVHGEQEWSQMDEEAKNNILAPNYEDERRMRAKRMDEDRKAKAAAVKKDVNA